MVQADDINCMQLQQPRQDRRLPNVCYYVEIIRMHIVY